MPMNYSYDTANYWGNVTIAERSAILANVLQDPNNPATQRSRYKMSIIDNLQPATQARIQAVIDLLQRSLHRIEDPKAWCQQAYQTDAHGHVTTLGSNHKGSKWCAIGSLDYEFSEAKPEIELKLFYLAEAMLNYFSTRKGHISIFAANDEGGHAVVMAVYTTSIQFLKTVQRFSKA